MIIDTIIDAFAIFALLMLLCRHAFFAIALFSPFHFAFFFHYAIDAYFR